jgi:hypothetical protein
LTTRIIYLKNRPEYHRTPLNNPVIHRSIYFRKEKALEGKSKASHSVHSPFFPEDKQEHWWCYIADRKNHALITPPNHVTALIDREEVELKFTAPQKPGTDTNRAPIWTR